MITFLTVLYQIIALIIVILVIWNILSKKNGEKVKVTDIILGAMVVVTLVLRVLLIK